jgi:gamma-glutamyl-gamma-aminobutyrate hydrolase PuuD
LKTLYSASYRSGYPFGQLCDSVVQVNAPDDMMEENAILVLWGGTDISPTLYNHPESQRTYAGAKKRDAEEWALLHRAVEMNIPIIGVCRGAQMLCAAAGGFLIQDVSNHAGADHSVTTYKGETFKVNTIHHQMMAGYEEVPHEMLAWCEKPLSRGYIYKDDKEYVPSETFVEAEAIYFPTLRGLAFQWHPEGMDMHSAAQKFVFEEIKHYEFA